MAEKICASTEASLGGMERLPVTQEVAGFNGYQAALVRRQLTPGLISSLSGTGRIAAVYLFLDNLPSDGLRAVAAHRQETS